jgi:hypothetical protein
MTTSATLYRRKAGPPVLVVQATERAEVLTPSGVTVAEAGDFIVERTPTDRYPVKPEAFAELYELADAGEDLAGTTDLEDELGGLLGRVESRAVEYLRTLGCHNAATLLGRLAELAKE